MKAGKQRGHHARPTPIIHVCPLADVPDTVERVGARRLVTLLADTSVPQTPSRIAAGRHLRLTVDDISASVPGMIAPGTHHVRQLITFVEAWDLASPMLIHCHAGVSRSTAAAFVAMCSLHPQIASATIALALRRSAPWASPNALILALADDLLERGGTMCQAFVDLGPPDLAADPRPFRLAAPFG